ADDPELAAIEVVPSSGPPGPPVVTAKTPTDGATGVATNTGVSASFSRAMDSTTFTSSSFTLARPDSTLVPASYTYDPTSQTATRVPNAARALPTTYTAKLDTTVKASDGTPLAAAVTWSFTTGSTTGPPPGTSTVRINVGGPAYTTSDGRVFSADQYFNG